MLIVVTVADVAVVAVASFSLQPSVSEDEKKTDGADAKASHSADTSQYNGGCRQCGVVTLVLFTSLEKTKQTGEGENDFFFFFNNVKV